MPFGLKNARATYQRAVNLIFHNLIEKGMEVYIDDIVVKSANFKQYLADLNQSFIKMQKQSLKMNSTKCAFGVSVGNFLGFLEHIQGIEVDNNKTKAMLEARRLRNKKNYKA